MVRKKYRYNPIKIKVGEIYQAADIEEDDPDLTSYFVIIAIDLDYRPYGRASVLPVRLIDDKWQISGGSADVKLDRFGYLEKFKRGLVDNWMGWQSQRSNPKKKHKSSKLPEWALEKDEYGIQCSCLLPTPEGERLLTKEESREIGYCAPHQASRCHRCGDRKSTRLNSSHRL